MHILLSFHLLHTVKLRFVDSRLCDWKVVIDRM